MGQTLLEASGSGVLMNSVYFLPSSNAAAFEYMKPRSLNELNVTEFEQFCGVGVVVTEDQIRDAVSYPTPPP